MQGRRELIYISGATHQAEAMRHPLGITILTPLTDLDATRNRVSRHFSPFDIQESSHKWTVYLYSSRILGNRIVTQAILLD